MKITALTINRKIDDSSLASMCMANDYYTCGDNRAYSKLLRMPYADDKFNLKILTDEDIIEMAEDIYEHSDIERFCEESGCSEQEVMNSIIFNIVNACWCTVDTEVKGE